MPFKTTDLSAHFRRPTLCFGEVVRFYVDTDRDLTFRNIFAFGSLIYAMPYRALGWALEGALARTDCPGPKGRTPRSEHRKGPEPERPARGPKDERGGNPNPPIGPGPIRPLVQPAPARTSIRPPFGGDELITARKRRVQKRVSQLRLV